MNKTNNTPAALRTRRTVCYIVLVLVTIMCLFWFYVLFVNATRSHAELARGFTLIPSGALVKNFKSSVNGTSHILRGLANSFIVAASSTVLCVYFSTMTAFAIHAYEFKLKKFAFTLILAIMMIPTQVTALGFISMLRKVGLMGSFIPLIVPSIAAPISVFYMKQYMESALPLELLEAARIDGASEMLTFNTIALPLMRPAIAVQAIFSFVASWNNYFTPGLVLAGQKTKKTLPIIIADLRAADFSKFDMGAVYMTIALSIFPVIVVYVILAKNIVEGLTVGAVKG